jgi:hypothetical protein
MLVANAAGGKLTEESTMAAAGLLSLRRMTNVKVRSFTPRPDARALRRGDASRRRNTSHGAFSGARRQNRGDVRVEFGAVRARREAWVQPPPRRSLALEW